MDISQIASGELALLVVAVIATGLAAGFLAGVFGIGGGAIMVPIFYQALGFIGIDDSVRMHLAVGTSLAVIVPTSIRSFLSHRAKGAVDMPLLRSYVLSVPAGVIAASITASYLSSGGLRLVFAVIALIVGLRLLFARDSWRLSGDIPSNPWRSVFGAAIGYFSTLMGIGGGVINNTFMTLFGRPIHQAVATSSGMGVLISVPGVFGYIWAGWGSMYLPVFSTGYINWIAVVLMIPITVLAAPYGVRAAHAMSKRQLETGFGIFLLLVSLRFFYSLA